MQGQVSSLPDDDLRELGRSAAKVMASPNKSPNLKDQLSYWYHKCYEQLSPEQQAEIEALKMEMLLPEILRRLS